MKRYDKLILARSAEQNIPFIKDIKNKNVKMFFILLFSCVSIPNLIKSRNSPVIPYLEFVVTERCTLKCRDCANLMQYYDKPQNCELEQMKEDIELLEKSGADILILQIIGGEPFMYKPLTELLKIFKEKCFVKKIQIVTNGTLIPNAEELSILKNKKFIIHISNYGKHSAKIEELVSVLKKNNIAFKLLEYDNWTDYGNLECRNNSEDKLKKMYHECAAAECKTLLYGKIFSCPRSAHMYNLGYIDNKKEFLDIRENIIDKTAIRNYYNREYIEACNYCNAPWERNEINAAEQNHTD